MTKPVLELSLKAYTAGDAAARRAFSDDFMRGLTEHGFVILKDHGVSTELLARAYRLAQEVFALPQVVKRRYAAGMRGYTPFGVEHAKDSGHPDLKEFWQIGHEPGADGDFPPNVWPAEAPGFQPTFLDLFARLNETGLVLLRALAPRLDLPESHFDPLVRRGTSILRVLHYPPLAADVDPQCARSAAHEDINLMTIMVAAAGAGLELLDRDGTWLSVETEPSNLIVDSGDMLARMTNGVNPRHHPPRGQSGRPQRQPLFDALLHAPDPGDLAQGPAVLRRRRGQVPRGDGGAVPARTAEGDR
ncbi:MAG: hypothetical protein JWO72_3072, partial [Caulobacteraceae bacterium]|nr:hypothetical protein [Caulobacteraceae bacterium]